MDQRVQAEREVLSSKTVQREEHETESSSGHVPSCVSFKSDESMDPGILFQGEHPSADNSSGHVPSCVSFKSDESMDPGILFQGEHPSADKVQQRDPEGAGSSNIQRQHPTDQDNIFMQLEEHIVTFVRSEVKKFQMVLCPDYPEFPERESEDIKEVGAEEEELRRSAREVFLKITLNFLRRKQQSQMAELLQSRMFSAVLQSQLKSYLRAKCQCVFEGIAKAGNPTLLNEIYTELYITEGGTGEVNDEHEVRQIEAASRKPFKQDRTIKQEDIFKALGREDRPFRAMMTKGVAGIGKTILVQKFTLDWAEGKANQDIQLMFPFTFRELNVLKEKKFSLVELVHHFFTETKEAGISRFEEFQVLFIFDGLDECRLPLDFHKNEILTDATKSTSVDVLVTNLIRGNLLPSAHLWITTRPAAANQIPPECVDMVTEVRGFTDLQKEKYFRKRFRDAEQADRIYFHVVTSQTLFTMCHIPVFCWITALVLEDELKTRLKEDLPNTLTELYVHFLMVQSKLKNIKYHGGADGDPHWSPETRKMIQSLGKLAFEHLQRGNLIFYEPDLTECGIDITAASVYSGVFTQIFKEERGLYQDKVFCFIHLSVQEFLAALHVHLTFINFGVNLLAEKSLSRVHKVFTNTSGRRNLYRSAVNRALQSPNGHLDLFLRFLLGLSLQKNQILLHGLQTNSRETTQTNEQVVKYIKKKIAENLSPVRNVNLFHCLHELNDQSLLKAILPYTRSGNHFKHKLTPAQWSGLGFILLSSNKDLSEFDLKKHAASEDVLLRMLPLVKASSTVLLSGCNLSERICKPLSSVLSSKPSNLTELDLTNNDLRDSGVKLLCVGLSSPQCRMETLRLSGCLITERGCTHLDSALRSNPSHLRELDLSYNHPGHAGLKLLSDGLEDPLWKLRTLRVDHCGEQWLKPGLRKYACGLTVDTNTVHRNLRLLDHNKTVTAVREEEPYPDRPERFTYWNQLLCEDGLTGRCYWEVEWRGGVYVSVSYRRIGRGHVSEFRFGGNDQSWSLFCSDEDKDQFSFWFDNMQTCLCSWSSVSNRIGVYLDHPAGTLSFYRVSSDSLIHLHTVHTVFTEPLHPGFGLWMDSSVSL